MELDEDLNDDKLSDDFDLGDGFDDSTTLDHDDAAKMDLLKSLTDFDPYIQDLVNCWLGLVWDKEKKSYVPNTFDKPIMNKHCASWLIGFLKTYVRKQNLITHITEKDYKQFQEDIIEVLWDNLSFKSKEYGIMNNGDLKRIAVECEHAIRLLLVGTRQGSYNRLISGTTHRTEATSYTESDQQKQKARYGVGAFINNLIKGAKK